MKTFNEPMQSSTEAGGAAAVTLQSEQTNRQLFFFSSKNSRFLNTVTVKTTHWSRLTLPAVHSRDVLMLMVAAPDVTQQAQRRWQAPGYARWSEGLRGHRAPGGARCWLPPQPCAGQSTTVLVCTGTCLTCGCEEAARSSWAV